ncbi:hypothetical protein [Thermus amyloliquefaciens]|uniref:hypothetical protein n=1 Tax=Thermus amyloliquefaciens TaxID=1449080 RepID=UPI00056EDE3A|nr:hypothetical protein [Thermus amyloliquefaciens]
MRRRTFLAKLLPLAVIFLAPAWGEEEKKGSKEKKKGEEEKKGRDEVKAENRPAPRYYGRVEGVEADTLWVGGRALRVHTPLLPYLAPGMVVEVGPEGLVVLNPAAWAYYQGPGSLVGLGEGPVRVWWGEDGAPWRVLPGYGEQASLVARYQRGTWQAVPKGLNLPRPPQDGWWLLALVGKTARLIQRLE